MSYCRWNDKCDVYCYRTDAEEFVTILPDWTRFEDESLGGMLWRLQELQKEGHEGKPIKVPQHIIEHVAKEIQVYS